MTKLSHFLASGLFTLVCAGVWFIWRVAKPLFAAHYGGLPLMEVTDFVLAYHDWLWALPVLAIIYSAIHLDRNEVLVEKVVLYAMIVACISAILILGTVALIGWEVSVVRSPSLGVQQELQ